MFENRFGQDPVTAAGPSLAGEQPITRQLRRRRLRTINLLSAAMLATVVSALMILLEGVTVSKSPWIMTLGLLAMWLVLFLGLGMFARFTAGLAMRMLDGWREEPDANAASDHAVFARTRQDPRLSKDVQTLLDAGAAPQAELAAAFTAPRYCRYL